MTTLSDRIAAEHLMPLGRGCVCDPGVALSTSHAAHVADVTERAVRDTIAQQLEEGRQAIHDTWIAAHHRLTPLPAAVCEAYTQAARIAREGTTP